MSNLIKIQKMWVLHLLDVYLESYGLKMLVETDLLASVNKLQKVNTMD